MAKKVSAMDNGKVLVVASTPPEPTPADYLMWVGAVYYPTVDSYIEEAKRLGPCKRIGNLPNNLTPGKSKIFLAHDDGVVGGGFIFGYFVPTQIQCLAVSEDDIPENIFDRVTWVSSWEDEESRECGDRREGCYLIGYSDEEDEEQPEFVVFKHPRILEEFEPGRKHFRGLLQVDWGNKVLKAKKSQTMVPPSRTAHKPIDPETPWTDEEDQAMLAFMNEQVDSGSAIQRAAQLWGYETGRAKSKIAYRYRCLCSKQRVYERNKKNA